MKINKKNLLNKTKNNNNIIPTISQFFSTSATQEPF